MATIWLKHPCPADGSFEASCCGTSTDTSRSAQPQRHPPRSDVTLSCSGSQSLGHFAFLWAGNLMSFLRCILLACGFGAGWIQLAIRPICALRLRGSVHRWSVSSDGTFPLADEIEGYRLLVRLCVVASWGLFSFALLYASVAAQHVLLPWPFFPLLCAGLAGSHAPSFIGWSL
ncbi:hypothetical protein DFH06DRAFT_607827 [Mycena polygramma]|nr:hypothetical protein DFH06DRAFT_607827 [Mycena polygramma]